MAKPDFFLLLYLGKRAGLFNSFKTSTREISEELGVSQQTVSRKLRDLKSADWIALLSSPSGCEVSLTEKGLGAIRKHYLVLKKFFESKPKFRSITGVVCLGFGEGKYYISQKGYLGQFKELLGFKPYFGTLNLKVDEAALNNFLLNSKPVFVKGFSTLERSFGGLKLFKIRVFDSVSGAIVIPERTRHEKNVIEIIAPCNLRKKFKLKEGGKLKISLA
ncbi:MAG: CTP-dependent riboflavin kinase [Candidatus Diapherotrites archaeon]|nr:CTP-dependent riboflavin kinase [Candidatus Diapherotrites archaeon]